MTTAPTDNWLPQESIALVDNAPLFSAGDGDHAVTFWQILVDSTPELSARSALECEEHWSRRIELEPIRDVVLRVGPAPPVLEDWTRLDDGRYVGRLSGQPSAVWLTVAKEGRLEIDPRSTPGYIETTEGRIYELAVSTRTAGAESQRLQPEERPATPFVVRFPRSPQELVGTQGLVIALSLALGFGMGVLADKDRALEQLSLSPTATEMVVPKSDGTASLEAELAAIQASRKAAEAELKAAKQAAAEAQKQAAAVTKRAEPKAEEPTGTPGAQVTRGGGVLPAGLQEAKMQAKESIGQTFATSRSPRAGWVSTETFESIRGICYHLPFSDYDLNQAQFDRLSDGDQRRFERISVPDTNPPLLGYKDDETGLAISGVRFHLPFTSYDLGQRTFDRLPREEQLRFEKINSQATGTWFGPVLIGRDGYPF